MNQPVFHGMSRVLISWLKCLHLVAFHRHCSNGSPNDAAFLLSQLLGTEFLRRKELFLIGKNKGTQETNWLLGCFG